MEEVALHCLGAIRDASSLLQLLEVLRVVQLAACRAAPGFCADPSGPPTSSLEEMGNAVLSYDCTLQQLSLSSNTKPKCCCCWQEVCVFWGEKGNQLLLRGKCPGIFSQRGEMGNQLLLRGKCPGIFSQHWRLCQVSVCGSALLLALRGWSWGCAWQSLLWQGGERAGHCWEERGRMQPMVRKAGGGIVNQNLSTTAVDVRPPCTIYNIRVQSWVCMCLAGIH